MKLNRALLLGGLACMFTAGVANAASVFLSVASGSWNNAANWIRVSGPGTNTYPGTGDTAIVSGEAISVDGGNATAATLYLANDGDLDVTAGDNLTVGACYIVHKTSTLEIEGTVVLGGGTLILSAGDVKVRSGGTFSLQGYVGVSGGTFTIESGGTAEYSGGTFDVDSLVQINGGAFEVRKGAVEVNAGGLIRLNGGRLTIGIADGVRLLTATSWIEVDADSTIGGNGSLRGDCVDAMVALNVDDARDVELIIEPETTVYGAMMFVRAGYGAGLAKLTNQGQLKASNSSFMLLLDASLDVIADDGGSCGRPNWLVNTGAVLEFDRSAPTLTSAFRIDGLLYIAPGQVVTTSGKKKVTGSGGIMGGFASSGTCP